MERQKQLQELERKRKESKLHLIESVSNLRETLRHHKRLRRQISLYLEEAPEHSKDIEEIADKCKLLNHDLEDLIEYRKTMQEVSQND